MKNPPHRPMSRFNVIFPLRRSPQIIANRKVGLVFLFKNCLHTSILCGTAADHQDKPEKDNVR